MIRKEDLFNRLFLRFYLSCLRIYILCSKSNIFQQGIDANAKPFNVKINLTKNNLNRFASILFVNFEFHFSLCISTSTFLIRMPLSSHQPNIHVNFFKSNLTIALYDIKKDKVSVCLTIVENPLSPISVGVLGLVLTWLLGE